LRKLHVRCTAAHTLFKEPQVWEVESAVAANDGDIVVSRCKYCKRLQVGRTGGLCLHGPYHQTRRSVCDLDVVYEKGKFVDDVSDAAMKAHGLSDTLELFMGTYMNAAERRAYRDAVLELVERVKALLTSADAVSDALHAMKSLERNLTQAKQALREAKQALHDAETDLGVIEAHQSTTYDDLRNTVKSIIEFIDLAAALHAERL